MPKPRHQLEIVDGLVAVSNKRGRLLLNKCFGSVQLSNGAFFSMHAMDKQVSRKGRRLIVEAGGDNVLPKLVWQALLINDHTVEVRLSITNTTPDLMPIERIDALICRNGYRRIPSGMLQLRRTGWQSFSPANLRMPFDNRDPWLQPPLYAPMMPPSSGDQWQLPWMTVLQTDDVPPLLIGFGGAKNYLGTIDLRSSSGGHRITATNQLEGIELQPGQTVTSEPLLLIWGKTEEPLLESYGTYAGEYMEARIPDHVPTGWSHWLYYFAKITEKDLLENIDIINEKDLPFEYIQVDDGYQTFFGDWLDINDKFPHGMKYLADKVRATGRRPGIWLSPFMADARSQVFKKHPDWFLRDSAGRHINVNRHGDPYWPAPNYGIDVTHPEAYKWLKKVFTTICEDWGYEYLKIDFLYAGALRAVRYDRNTTSIQAYRRGMALIRRIAGDRLVLGCGAPLLSSVGMVDDMRIGPDLSWEFDTADNPPPLDHTKPLTREPLLSLFSHQWMNKKLWINDADYVRLRQHNINLDWTQTVALTTLIAMGGGALYDSDKLSTLEPQGYALLDRLYPVADISGHPVGAVRDKPTRLLGTVIRGTATWQIAARFNWGTEPKPSRFYPVSWGLPIGQYHVYDLLNETYVGLRLYERFEDTPSKGVSLYSLCAAQDYPQVVATKGHLLGPAGDISRSVWRQESSRLTVNLTPDRRTDTRLYVHIPIMYKLLSVSGCEVEHKNGQIITLKPIGDTCRLSFKSRITLPDGLRRKYHVS